MPIQFIKTWRTWGTTGTSEVDQEYGFATWQKKSYLFFHNIQYTPYSLLGTSIHLQVHEIIQLANHLAAEQCIKS